MFRHPGIKAAVHPNMNEILDIRADSVVIIVVGTMI